MDAYNPSDGGREGRWMDGTPTGWVPDFVWVGDPFLVLVGSQVPECVPDRQRAMDPA